MAHYEEKRRYPRYKHNIPMSLYRMDFQDQYSYAELKDYSHGGLSMLSNEKLVIDQVVYLEIKNHKKHTIDPEKCKSYCGYIKWKIPYSSSNCKASASYKYGVKYY